MDEDVFRNASAIPAGRPTRVRYAVLLVLCSLAFLTYFDRICIMRVQKDIRRDLHFDELTREDEELLRKEGKAEDAEAREKLAQARGLERMGWVFSAFLVGYAIFEIPGGWLGDVWGPRLVIFRIVIWWSIFTALTGSVQSLVGWFTSSPSPWMLLWTLVLVRFLFGVGEAGAYPNISRAVGRWFPFRQRATAQGLIWMSSRLGGAISPAVMGALIAFPGPLAGWQGAFWILGAAGLLWALGFFLWFRDRPEERPPANAAECELIRAGAAGPGSIYDDSHLPGVPWKKVLFAPNLLAIYGAAFCVSFSWYFYVTFFPEYLERTFGRSYKDSEWLSGLPLLAGGFACLAGGRLSDWLIRRTGSKRWGRSALGIAGFGLAAACAYLLSQRFLTYGQAVALSCLALGLQDLAIPAIWSVTADVGGRYAGTVAGCMNTMGAIGGAVASPLAARVAGPEKRWDLVFLMFAGSYLLGALFWIRIDATESIFSRGTPRPPAG